MIFKRLKEDIDSFIARDPAARTRLEVALLYPGFHAIQAYRLSHWLWRHDVRFIARMISQAARFFTGIEIHPGATIGRRFFIDHGDGVVIGETSKIGDDVTIYQIVTLGGTSPSVDSHTQVNQKRHPTLEDGVIVGSGAQVLGPITVGKDARIGANAVVTRDVPSGVTAVGIPARVVMPRDKEHAKDFVAYGTPSDGCPDPVLRTIDNLRAQVSTLMERVEELEYEQDAAAKSKDEAGSASAQKKVVNLSEDA
ncbi:serine O-acetyltransferase [Magnetovibrio sp. PR-2]|uniref:serine O-acetyltransferase n=1 Tax=Magnetovibrio sp. PR-2 TaxID=3120356 RepID=UPI002FCE56E7